MQIISEQETKVANKLKASADAMTKKIEAKLNPAVGKQNHTARRARIASGMFETGVYLKQIQDGLYALVEAKLSGRCPLRVTNVTTKAQVEYLINSATYNRNEDVLKAMMSLGLYWQEIFEDAKSDMLSLVNMTAFEKERLRRALAAKEKELIGQVAGYFPTPAKVVERMLEMMDIDDAELVCDPFAGGGAILDVVKHYNPDILTVGMEINATLAQIAANKGHGVIQGDTYQSWQRLGTFEHIIMNPPFENDGDCEGVMFAYDSLLAMHGELTAVTSSGAFSHTTKTALEFQELVRQQGYYEALPTGSFKESKTGVNTCVVYLRKD